ncbi:MAG TPA: pitrilysin family protein [Candidatus Paceibacterota bacterium]
MKFKKTTLRNGLRVITVPMQDNPAVTILVMVSAGSKYETKALNGISHFLEHMVFKGTPKRPKASDISRELDGLGAQYNAFTSQEYTGYYAKVDSRHFDTALDIISDMYQNPLFEEGEIVKEKGVIIEEMKMYKDLPQRHVHDVLAELMFGDQPTGWSIIGTEKNIKSFNRSHFVEYRKKHYVSSATTVIFSGSIREDEVIKKAEKLFSKISKDKKCPKLPVKESQNKPAIKLAHKDTDQTHLVIALRTFPISDKRMSIMRVLSAILGQGMSSRLFSKMRDELGICYYIKTSHNPNTDHGDLTISAGVDNKRVDLGIKHILIELKRMKDELVSPEELKKAKDYISGTTMLELETSDAQAEFVGYQEILKGEIELPENIIKEINKVTAEEVRDLAREIFIDEGLNMAIIGPYKDKKRFRPLLTLK